MKENEKVFVRGYRLWLERIRGNKGNKPFSKYSVLVLEKEAGRRESYKRLVCAGGGQVVRSPETANLIICEKRAVKDYLPNTPLSHVPVREPVFLNDVLLKDLTLEDD